MYNEASLGFSKKMMESGTDTMTKMYEQNADYLTNCAGLAQTAQEKMTGISSMSGLMELQRDYSKGLWEASKSAYQENMKLMKESYETSSTLMKEAYTSMKDYTPDFPPAESKAKKPKEKAAA